MTFALRGHLQKLSTENAYLNAGRPIGVHVAILVVETLQLQLEIGAPHQRLVHGRFQLKHVIAHRQIVFEPERGKYDAVAHGKSQPQFVVFCQKNRSIPKCKFENLNLL